MPRLSGNRVTCLGRTDAESKGIPPPTAILADAARSTQAGGEGDTVSVNRIQRRRGPQGSCSETVHSCNRRASLLSPKPALHPTVLETRGCSDSTAKRVSGGNPQAVQGLRICLPAQGTQVQSLAGELRCHVPRGNEAGMQQLLTPSSTLLALKGY